MDLARDGRVPDYVRKLIEGYELRVYWFELVECLRKILLVGMPVFFEMGSVAQLSYGLLVCFLSFGAYMLLTPYTSESDDRLAQLCQMQIFFSLVASIMLRHAREISVSEGRAYNSNLDVLLCVLTFLPLGFGLGVHVLEEGLYDYLWETWVQPAQTMLAPYVGVLRRAAAMGLQLRMTRKSSSRRVEPLVPAGPIIAAPAIHVLPLPLEASPSPSAAPEP